MKNQKMIIFIVLFFIIVIFSSIFIKKLFIKNQDTEKNTNQLNNIDTNTINKIASKNGITTSFNIEKTSNNRWIVPSFELNKH